MTGMLFPNTGKFGQCVFSLLLVAIVSLFCFAFSGYMGYRVVALLLLLTVSLIAMLFDILAVLTAAAASALTWNYFFIPPRFTFHVSATDDAILFAMYFIIALVNAVLTFKIRQAQKEARQREEKANTVKLYDTLLNSLSHELRTPIATIVGATDNLQSNSIHLTAQHRADLLAEISKAAFRLNQQVENLLNMSRLESGFLQPRKDWCDISEIVYDAVKRVEESKPGQQIVIGISPSLPLFRLDKGMLEQVVYNLLNNAVLYTGADRTISVAAACHIHVLHLVIEDNGEGFPEAEIKKAFDKFYRLNGSRTGGTGLGLSIVKGFTEALGGTVRLENIPAGGARFTIAIPAATSHLDKKPERWLARKY